MRIHVEYIDQQGVLSVQKPQMPLPGFLKHAAIAGQGSDFGLLPSLARGLGAMFLYGRYIDTNWWFAFRGFRKADMRFLDPTEQGDLSTLVGKAIADYLAKRLLGAKFSHTYEAAMYAAGYTLAGPRPDFYCTTPTQQFAMEAKGYSQRSVSTTEMATHKLQSKAGPIPVHFSVASVTYNIYESLRCKFHDPINERTEFLGNVNNTLAKQYYLALHEQLVDYIAPSTFEYGNRQYESYDISPYLFIGRSNRPVALLFDKQIMKNIERENVLRDEYPFFSEQGLYLDTDGVGIRVG